MGHIFISYSQEDEKQVLRLYKKLKQAGFKPWLDREDILPGQDRQREIRNAINTADIFLACLSNHSVSKRGMFQKQIKLARDVLMEFPENRVYFIPLRLDYCEIPEKISNLQWINLFETDGFNDLVAALSLYVHQKVTQADKTIIDERLSTEYKDRGRDQVQKWGEDKKRGNWNWHNLGNALEYYLDAIKYNPYHQHAWTNIAYVYYLIGKVEMVEICLQRSYELAKPGSNHPGRNYKNVEKAVKSNAYLSGGSINRPPIPTWVEDKYRDLLTLGYGIRTNFKNIEYYLKNWEIKTPPGNESVKKILILSANPRATLQLRWDEEVREIEEGLRRSTYRDQFEIRSRLAVRLRDLRRALLDVVPQIVHFTGHGNEDGLLVEDELGMAKSISSKALAGLFELCSGHVKCVILSACLSEPQADAISKHINYVVGMKKEIEDEAAIEFAVGFYDALGAGRPVDQAFKFGCNAILQIFPDLSEHLIPVLKRRPKSQEK